MKNLKKIMGIMLVLVMVLAMTTTAFASATETGTITIANASYDESGALKAEYRVYQILKLVSYDIETEAYSYEILEAWKNFFAEGADGAEYIKFDAAGKVVTGEGGGTLSDANAAEFAQKALAFAKTNRIAPVKTTADTADYKIENEKVVFENLELGYYLVDSSVGALCALTTTNPVGQITAKNKIPTINKQVKEDGDGKWYDHNTAGIGELVEFRAIIEVHSGAENYVMHDEMSDGLTFVEVTGVEHYIPATGATPADVHDVEPQYYTVKTGADVEDGHACDFEVALSNTLFEDKTIAIGTTFVVYYTARVNEDAVIGGNGNANDVYMEYGEENYTTKDTTITYVYGADVVKTDGQNFLLDGAAIKLYETATGGNAMKFIQPDAAKAEYRLLTQEEADQVAAGEVVAGLVESIVIKDGKARIDGFDAGVYYFEETVVPDGYNGIIGRHSFTITNRNLDASITAQGNKLALTPNTGVQIKNNKGSVLPSTGGMGTTLFYIGGGILVAAAVVLLIAKRRMSAE